MALKLPETTLSFLVLSIIWGLTWIGVKAGVQTVPPLFFAGSRFTVAGIVLLAFAYRSGGVDLPDKHWPRLALASLLMITLCYAPLFWGMKYVDSGTSAVIEMSLTPVALMGFALVFRQERLDLRKVLAIAIGVFGLAVLFGPTALSAWTSSDVSLMRLWGVAAMVAAALSYGLGSVISKPLLAMYSSTAIAGITTFAGGSALLCGSIAFEPGAYSALSGNWGVAAWSGWIFLVVFGSLIGYSIYMRLLRDIGASRAGTFAFVSPVIAVLVGVVAGGESVGLIQVAGMIIMLSAAWLAMASRAELSIGNSKYDRRIV